jgi:hypothetical protein
VEDLMASFDGHIPGDVEQGRLSHAGGAFQDQNPSASGGDRGLEPFELSLSLKQLLSSTDASLCIPKGVNGA